MTYQVTKDGLIFTVRSEAEAKRYAEEGSTVVALTEMVIRDGVLVPIDDVCTATGSGSGEDVPGDPLKTGRDTES